MFVVDQMNEDCFRDKEPVGIDARTGIYSFRSHKKFSPKETVLYVNYQKKNQYTSTIQNNYKLCMKEEMIFLKKENVNRKGSNVRFSRNSKISFTYHHFGVSLHDH